mmetsp:Transcript_3488/g.5863  ORF Transcript_3488/g.5863 Transcript_3488/m.5863 type:complete len:209 (-) Transcript_3488:280-906(-)
MLFQISIFLRCCIAHNSQNRVIFDLRISHLFHARSRFHKLFVLKRITHNLIRRSRRYLKVRMSAQQRRLHLSYIMARRIFSRFQQLRVFQIQSAPKLNLGLSRLFGQITFISTIVHNRRIGSCRIIGVFVDDKRVSINDSLLWPTPDHVLLFDIPLSERLHNLSVLRFDLLGLQMDLPDKRTITKLHSPPTLLEQQTPIFFHQTQQRR